MFPRKKPLGHMEHLMMANGKKKHSYVGVEKDVWVSAENLECGAGKLTRSDGYIFDGE